MTLFQLCLALLALLLTPGPTNTLMLLAGGEGGPRRVLALIPVELAAYLAVILPLALLATELDRQLAAWRPLVAGLAGVWVLFLAFRLWRPATLAEPVPSVTALHVGLTTLLNPKGFIMGLVLLPAAGATAPAFALLALCIIAVALLWGGAGAALRHLPGHRPDLGLIRRAAAIWLSGLSLLLLSGGMTPA